MPEAVREEACFSACWPGVGRLEGPCAILSKWFLPTSYTYPTQSPTSYQHPTQTSPNSGCTDDFYGYVQDLGANCQQVMAAGYCHDNLGKHIPQIEDGAL